MDGNAYWVIPGRLMAGAYPGSPKRKATEARLSGLVQKGVRAFLDLTEPAEPTPLGPLRPYHADLPTVGQRLSAELSYARFPIRDLGVPGPGLMKTILDALDATLGAGRPAYVHCLGGRGRTGTVVGCYLVRHAERLLGAGAGDDAGLLALRRILELRTAEGIPPWDESPQTLAQVEMVQGWRQGM